VTGKLCPGCGERKERDAFYEEPTDTVTGLSALCRVCITAKKAKPKKRKIAGWHVKSPAGLVGTVLNVREETSEIVVRFKGSRTVVLPMRVPR
jgi:hypothetical protein